MKTNITTNKTAAELRKIITRETEYLPNGVKYETLVDLYRAITAENIALTLRATTAAGRKLAMQAQAALDKCATIEDAAAFTDALYDLYDRYTNTDGVDVFNPTIDTIHPKFRSDFIAAVNARA